MEKVNYTGRTAIGSHVEQIQKGKDKGKDTKVIDYASASLSLDTPQTVAEAVKFLGEKRVLAHVIYAHTIHVANAIRRAVQSVAGYDSGDVDDSVLVKAAQDTLANYPNCLPDGSERAHGVRRSSKELARSKALAVLNDIGSSYESLPKAGKAAFDARYPLEVTLSENAPSEG